MLWCPPSPTSTSAGCSTPRSSGDEQQGGDGGGGGAGVAARGGDGLVGLGAGRLSGVLVRTPSQRGAGGHPHALTAVDHLIGYNFPAPLLVKNTFIDVKEDPSRLLSGFYQERSVRSCPASSTTSLHSEVGDDVALALNARELEMQAAAAAAAKVAAERQPRRHLGELGAPGSSSCTGSGKGGGGDGGRRHRRSCVAGSSAGASGSWYLPQGLEAASAPVSPTAPMSPTELAWQAVSEPSSPMGSETTEVDSEPPSPNVAAVALEFEPEEPAAVAEAEPEAEAEEAASEEQFPQDAKAYEARRGRHAALVKNRNCEHGSSSRFCYTGDAMGQRRRHKARADRRREKGRWQPVASKG